MGIAVVGFGIIIAYGKKVMGGRTLAIVRYQASLVTRPNISSLRF